MTRAATATISRAAVAHNLARVRALAPGRPIYAVVKADAYGHGLEPLLETLASAGADAFAVACLEEAERIRAAGIKRPILLLEGWADHDELVVAKRLALDVAVHCEEQLKDALVTGTAGLRAIWLKLDSGMHRIGLGPDAVASAWSQLRARVEPLGLMSHFACADDRADDFTTVQLRAVQAVAKSVGAARLSTHNSAAILNHVQVSGEENWLRPGVMLYGLSPLPDRTADALQLRPAMTFSSVVMAVLNVARGEGVGYGLSWRAERDSRVAVVAAGYGDGYPRHAPTGTPVLVAGHRAPLVGRVSMDMLSVDVTDLPDVKRGARAVLWGEGLPVDEIAAAANTLGYELVCKVTARVRRQYV